jgi:diguanylate cyclase (GGDEF)-like protein
MLALMQHYLGGDFTLFLARSAEEALEILQREQLHAVVSDQNLGDGLMGVDLLKKVAEIQPHAARILVTASQKLEDAQKAINEARVNHYLTKPFTERELKDTVGKAVHNAALAAIREKMVQELKEQLGLRNAKAATGRKADARSPESPRSPESDRVAFRDALTGLYNHRYFQEALSAGLVSARRRDQKLSLVLIDIDDFRRFNLTRSYAEGDKMLRRVAQLMMEEPSPTSKADAASEIAARYGWDVFAVVLQNADLERGRRYAESICREVEEFELPPAGSAASPKVTVSAAVAVFPDHATNAQDLIAAAERALQAAKDAGRNCVKPALRGE